MELYLLVDTLLLSEVIIKFRSVCIREFKLDPAAHCSTPSIAEQSALYMKNKDHKIELLSDPEVINDIKCNIKGGYCGVSIGHVMLNDSSTPEYDPLEEEVSAIFADVKSLYPTIMDGKVPIGDFTKLDGDYLTEFKRGWKSLPTDGDYAYLVWFKFRISDDVKRRLDDYPLIFNNKIVDNESISPYTENLINECGYKLGSSKSLIASHEGNRYFTTLGYMQLMHQLGVEIIEIEKVYRFQQEVVFRNYIRRNIELRNAALTPFERNLFKLFSNSLFGKLLFNAEKNQIRTYIVTTLTDFQEKINNIFLTDAYPIDDDKVIIKLRDNNIRLNHPQYIGFFILEEAKKYMANLFHNVIKKFYPNTRCAYTDTDSMLLIFKGINIIDSLKDTPLIDYFDTSNFDRNHSCYDASKHDQIGLLKSETGSCHISEIVCLQPKCYAIRLSDGSLKTACKGINRTVAGEIPFQTFLDVHNSIQYQHLTRNASIVSRKNQLSTVISKKRAFCKVDRKRYYLDAETSVAYGHPDIPKRSVKRKVTENESLHRNISDTCLDNVAIYTVHDVPSNFTGHIKKKFKAVNFKN